MAQTLMTRILRYWIPVAVWVGLIFQFSTDVFHGDSEGLTDRLVQAVLLFFLPDLSPQTIALVHDGIRKLAHVFEYGILTLLLYRAFRQDSLQTRYARWALLSLLVTLGIAGLDEFHQSFTLKRFGLIRDVGFDALGALIALVMVWGLFRDHRKDLQSPDR